MKEKLLNCPFCGGEARAKYDTKIDVFGGRESKIYHVWCTTAGCVLCEGFAFTIPTKKSEAIKAWNRRAK